MRDAAPCLLPQVLALSVSRGAVVEQYLAEEAVGLATSLGWTVVKGPYWNN
jgi:hypothetical protein